LTALPRGRRDFFTNEQLHTTDAKSFLETLSEVVQTGIQVLIYAGDADYICNWVGSFGVANNIAWDNQAAFKSKALTTLTVNGTAKGLFKNIDNLSFIRVYEAGHEVPYYRKSIAARCAVFCSAFVCSHVCRTGTCTPSLHPDYDEAAYHVHLGGRARRTDARTREITMSEAHVHGNFVL
jgi:hypothetical protein